MKTIIKTLICILLLGIQSALAQNKQPYILFAKADDASWKHFGAYGCNWVSTAGFDQVAKKGILFKNAYIPNVHPQER